MYAQIPHQFLDAIIGQIAIAAMQAHWDDLRIFLSVAREESLSGAGRVLKIDPATVGRRIARLERALGASLFVKSPQGYTLSAAGERLLSQGEQAEQAMRAVTEALDGPSEGLAGQMRIGAPDGCANYLLPQVCARIGEENPDLDIQIVALPRIVNLSRREADMAIAVSAPSAGQLLVQKITDYRLHLVASRSYLRDHPPLDRVEDLRDRRMVGYIPDMRRLDTDVQRLRAANDQLRQSNAALRAANESGVGEPELINQAMQAELEGLRAARATDVAEIGAVLAKLEPLLAGSAAARQGEEV